MVREKAAQAAERKAGVKYKKQARGAKEAVRSFERDKYKALKSLTRQRNRLRCAFDATGSPSATVTSQAL